MRAWPFARARAGYVQHGYALALDERSDLCDRPRERQDRSVYRHERLSVLRAVLGGEPGAALHEPRVQYCRPIAIEDVAQSALLVTGSSEYYDGIGVRYGAVLG